MSASAAAGTIVADRYQLDAPSTGMDGAFQATDLRLERVVTVRLFPVGAWTAEDRARFQRDVKSAARLAHANVAGVLDFGTDAVAAADFVVTEMLRGEQLAALLAQRGTPPFPFALRVLQEAAAGVAAGHRAGIVHGELHPGTLFLSRGEEDRRVRVRVTGFGARSAAALRTGAARYAAPEALRRGAELTAACDVFSLGVVALEILVGLPAQWGSTLAALVRGQPAALPSLAELRPELPAALCEAVQRALSPDPAARFADAGGFAEALGLVPVAAEARTPAAPAEPPVVAAPPAAPEPALAEAPAIPVALPVAMSEPLAAESPAEPAVAGASAAPPPAGGRAARAPAQGWKLASATDLGDHLYIPPALLDQRAAEIPAPAAPAPLAASAPVVPLVPVVPEPAPLPAAVAEPTVVAAEPVFPAAEPARTTPAVAVPVLAIAPIEAPPAAVITPAAEPARAAAPVRVPRLGMQRSNGRSPAMVGGAVAALLAVAAVAFAATRPETPQVPTEVAAAAQQRLAAPLPGAAQPTAPVASSAERTAPAAAAKETPPSTDPRAEAQRREEERKPEEDRRRVETRRQEELRAQQLAAQRLAAEQAAARTAAQQQPPPVMRQVAVPVAPPERAVATSAAVSRPEPAEVRESAPVVDPSRVYGAGEVDSPPSLQNATELAREAGRSVPAGETGGGRVVLGFVVTESGRVDPSSISVVSTSSVRLNGPARRVVGRARFTPATANGRPVKIRTQLPLIFPEQ